jgi:riboflavin kinase / FMN adenylyltransferase
MMITYSTTTKKGFGRGKTLGFPTINMEIPERVLQEKRGIYAARVTLGAHIYDAALYFGPPITFGVTNEQLEVYLIDTPSLETTEEKTSITCSHIAYIRPVVTFSNTESLISQIHNDIIAVRDVLRNA